MAQTIIYLNFNGDCKEAMEFYRDALGGKLELQTIAESPMAEHMPNANPNNILHSALTNGSMVIMASDMVHGAIAENGSGYNICLVCDSEKQVHEMFNKLGAGGTVVEKLAEAPWGAIFGMLNDKFGKSWMFNYTLT